MYRRMIHRWQELGKPMFLYSRDVIINILAARIHPDNQK